MREEIAASLTAVAERLTTIALQDQELRQLLRRLASAVIAAVEPPKPSQPEVNDQIPPAPLPIAEAASTSPATVTEEPSVVPEAPPVERVLVIEPTIPVLPMPPVAIAEEFQPVRQWADVEDGELPEIEARCELKAEAARWAQTRRQRIAAGVDYRLEIEPLDREIIERAKAIPGCFLWMSHPDGPSPSDLSLYEDVAGCFDAVACGVSLVRSLLEGIDGQTAAFEQALDLLAEAQSALRMSIVRLDAKPDFDQIKVFRWLRSASNKYHLFLQRFMRVDDPADPANCSDLNERIQIADWALQEGRRRQKHHQQTLGRIRFHLAQIAKSSGDPLYHWQAVVSSVDDIVKEGTPPSNISLREVLTPAIDSLPDIELPPRFQLVLREMDHYLATRVSSPTGEQATEATKDVTAVAELLAGRTIVLIGGVRRPFAYEALKVAFRLKNVDWIETNEHESITTFESHVARPEVALVLLAIRWSSHVFGEVKQFCDLYGKPLVRLPAGYNPNQVAAQILGQVSDRLACRT